MGILPTLQMASKSAPPGMVPLLRVAEESAERAAGVVRQLMTYAARNQETTRRTEPVAPLVERVAGFCRTTFDRRVALDLQCREASSADMDGSQIEQAILNLLINARDALEDVAIAAPTIQVAVEAVAPGAPELERRTGEWIAIRIADNGVGMDAATVQRIYEPFFTTKPAGKGTGLGLATTQVIVREHGGFITCRSAPRKGTTFTVYLPRSGAFPSRAAGPGPTSNGVKSARAVDAAVLVVDDDEAVRSVTCAMLESEGFRVELASSGDEALARLEDPSRRAPIDLVLLDVSMPGLSGPEVRRRLTELAPGIPVVFLTGYSYQPPPGNGDTVIQKPVTQAALAASLREILGRARASV